MKTGANTGSRLAYTSNEETKMLLQSYKEDQLMWLTTCHGDAGDGAESFRGDLVIIHGELKPVSGTYNLPVAQIRQAVLLEKGGKLVMVAGNLASVDELPAFVEKYQGDLADDALVMLYIDNLGDDAVVDVDGIKYSLFRFGNGMVWNELLDEAALDKGDFKGQKPEEKVVTLYDELKGYVSKAGELSMDEVLASKTEAKKEAWGAI